MQLVEMTANERKALEEAQQAARNVRARFTEGGVDVVLHHKEHHHQRSTIFWRLTPNEARHRLHHLDSEAKPKRLPIRAEWACN